MTAPGEIHSTGESAFFVPTNNNLTSVYALSIIYLLQHYWYKFPNGVQFLNANDEIKYIAIYSHCNYLLQVG
jgi:hypothetical protein